MAYWPVIKKSKTGNNKNPIVLGNGVDRNGTIFSLNESFAWDSRNTSSRNYNALSTKNGRLEYATTISASKGVGVRNNEYMHVIDGTSWKYWDYDAENYSVVTTGLTSANAKFVEFNTEAKKYTVMFNGTEKKAWDGTNTPINLTEAPNTNLIAVDDFRLYALLGNILSCSAEGSVTDWDPLTYPNDAESVVITGMRGNGTALKAFSDMVIAWSDLTMHILFGNDPYDFYLSDPMEYGCISDKSVIEHDTYLYWLDNGRIMQFLSGKPKEISQPVRYWLEGINQSNKAKAVSGSHGKYLYLSIPYGENTDNSLTFEFDTERGTWYIWGEGYSDFFNIGNNFYGVDSTTGQPYQLNTGNHSGEWYHITGMNFKGFNKQSVSSIPALVDLPSGSTLKLAFNTSVNSPSWTDIYTFTASSDLQSKNIHIPINKLNNIDFYQLKFYGTGPCTVHFIGEDLRVKER